MWYIKNEWILMTDDWWIIDNISEQNTKVFCSERDNYKWTSIVANATNDKLRLMTDELLLNYYNKGKNTYFYLPVF